MKASVFFLFFVFPYFSAFLRLIWFQLSFFALFLGMHMRHKEVHRLGVTWSCSCMATLQPQQHGIPATSVIYTTGQGNTGSLIHCKRPGIQPTSSWILGRFITAEPQREIPYSFYLFYFLPRYVFYFYCLFNFLYFLCVYMSSLY